MNNESWKLESSGLLVPERDPAHRKKGDKSRSGIRWRRTVSFVRRGLSAKSWGAISQIVTTLIAVLALILSIRTQVNQDRQGQAATAEKVAIIYKDNTAEDQRYTFYNYSPSY